MRSVTGHARLAVLLLLAADVPAAAEDEKKLGWADTAEFSLVATAGNADSESLGFKNTAIRTWQRSLLTLRAAGVRVEAESGSRVAMDNGAGGFVVIDPDSEITAESYLANGRYDRTISGSLFWFSGAGWDRNEPAGIENRWLAEGGLGHVWHDTDDLKFKTDYGATFTKQEDVDEDPTLDDTFLGARVGWDYLNKLTESTTYTNVLVVDDNLEETSDWRATMSNGLAVAMTGRLALKINLRFDYDHEPALEQLALLDLAGLPTGTTVVVPLDELDTIFTVSLVASFQ